MSGRRILFVCTGNSCRSVMAEYLLRHLLGRAGLGAIRVESAGVFAVEGMSPTRETARVLQECGIECGSHRARALTADMIRGADLVFVMEPFHAEEAIRRLPDARDKVHLLKTFGLSADPDDRCLGIPDPIGKPLEVYEVCFATIHEAVERVAKSLGMNIA